VEDSSGLMYGINSSTMIAITLFLVLLALLVACVLYPAIAAEMEFSCVLFLTTFTIFLSIILTYDIVLLLLLTE
jgi:hypothetical protein